MYKSVWKLWILVIKSECLYLPLHFRNPEFLGLFNIRPDSRRRPTFKFTNFIGLDGGTTLIFEFTDLLVDIVYDWH